MTEDYRNHAWRYFELHASQRMAVFNFFLVLSGLIAAGLAAAVQAAGLLLIVGAVLGLLLALVSFIFWKLDQRVSFLIKHAEQALIEIESVFPKTATQLFTNEVALTEHATSSGSLWTRQWTYGHSFRVVFIIMGLAGLLGSCISLGRYAGWICWPGAS